MKHRIWGATVAAGAILLLSSCSLVGSSSGGAEKSNSFTYWSMWSKGEPQQVALQKAIDEFTKSTGIKVDVQWDGRSNVTKVAPTLNSAKSPVDLIDAAQRNIDSTLVQTDQYTPLGDVLNSKIPGEANKTVGEVIPKNDIDLVSKGGQPWMIPYEVITSGFWFNGAAHPELVSNPPRTWDQLIDVLQKYKDATGRGPLALDGDIANYNLYYYAELAVRNTGPGQLNKAAGDKSGNAFKAPSFKKAAEEVQQLVKGGYFATGYSSSKWPALQQQWAQGKSELDYNGTWIPHESAAYAAKGFEYHMFPMPAVKAGGDVSPDVSFIGFGIPKKATHADAAKKFIAYFMNKERLGRISSIATNLTPRTDIPVPTQLSDAKQLIDSATKIHGQFDGIESDYGDWTTKVLIPLVNSLIFGTIDADTFSAELPKQSAQYWSNNG
ncbi:MAG: extracellular solute-binding protein [Microbacteriaceae bacterium]|nr:MAG: extracellular solute-binding protein [Microbacteriaceae bacterium]